MALYSYIKERPSRKKNAAHAMSYVSLTIGAVLLFWSFYPIISFEIYSRLFIQNNVLTPVPRTQIASSLTGAGSVLSSTDVFSSNLKDFVDANQWFTTKPQAKTQKKMPIHDYTISIPKINIMNAKVTVGGEDLSKSLVHYLPESLPGEFGNVTIFGHSTLPQLYDKNNYKTIFTYLPSLENGDTIIAKDGDIEYEYVVYDRFVVKPDHISVLDQRYDASYLTLITCVPPGTYWLRLVIRAKLKTLPESL